MAGISRSIILRCQIWYLFPCLYMVRIGLESQQIRCLNSPSEFAPSRHTRQPHGWSRAGNTHRSVPKDRKVTGLSVRFDGPRVFEKQLDHSEPSRRQVQGPKSTVVLSGCLPNRGGPVRGAHLTLGNAMRDIGETLVWESIVNLIWARSLGSVVCGTDFGTCTECGLCSWPPMVYIMTVALQLSALAHRC